MVTEYDIQEVEIEGVDERLRRQFAEIRVDVVQRRIVVVEHLENPLPHLGAEVLVVVAGYRFERDIPFREEIDIIPAEERCDRIPRMALHLLILEIGKLSVLVKNAVHHK